MHHAPDPVAHKSIYWCTQHLTESGALNPELSVNLRALANECFNCIHTASCRLRWTLGEERATSPRIRAITWHEVQDSQKL